MTTANKTFLQLCEEVDYYKEKAEYFENLYKQERDKYSRQLNDSLEEAKKGVGQALMFALSVSDDANGNLVITKENRKQLANQCREVTP